MTSAAVHVIARRPTAPEDDETSDVTITKLKLAGALKKGGIDIDVTRVITDGHVEDSTTGAPQFTLDILDRDYAALQSGVFGQTVDVELDRIPWRLAELNLTDVERLELLFEHKLVNVLRQFKTPIKAARSSVNRCQFVEMMLREAAPTFGPIRFVCPEINRVQPIAGAKPTGRALVSKTFGASLNTKNVRESGFGLTHLNIQDWDGSTAVLGPSQLSNASTVLQVCQQLNAGAKATLAVMAACIVEPSKPFENTVGGGGGSSGILQWVSKSWANDVAQSVTNALKDPGATGKGGMISLAQANPGWSPGTVAQAEQGSSFGSRYDRAVPGAQTVIDAFTSAGGFAATAGATSTAYEFSRGQPGQSEDSWTCMQRLAQEVNWRCFVAGRNTVYMVTDDDLMNAPPAYALTPSTPGMTKLTFQVEVGGRTVRVHGKRQPKPSEGELTVRVDRWAAVPGGVLTLDGYGPADARWLIIDATRPLFDTEATVRIQSPQKPLPEPAPTASVTGGTAGGATTGTSSGFPSPESGQYRNPPPSGPVGLGTFQGFQVALWIIPQLQYAQAHGWTGTITSGYRPGGSSEHAGTQYPNGAVDFGGPGPVTSPGGIARAAFFAACRGYTGPAIIPAQFPPYDKYPQGDGGHASGTGH